MANFGSFWPKWAKREFFKKALGTFFWRLQALTNCKVSEKSNERFSSTRMMHGRTYGRTNGRESLGLQRLRRETKNSENYNVWIFRKIGTYRGEIYIKSWVKH